MTPIWKPLGQGRSLESLRTTFDTWLPPGPPLNLCNYYLVTVAKLSLINLDFSSIADSLVSVISEWYRSEMPLTKIVCFQMIKVAKLVLLILTFYLVSM